MKKYFVLAMALLVLFAMSSTTFAEVPKTGNPAWTTQCEPLNGLLDEYATHEHPYQQTSKYKSPLGYMLDVTLYRIDALGIPCAVGVQGTYDQNNAVWGAYAKVSVDLSPMIKKLIGQ